MKLPEPLEKSLKSQMTSAQEIGYPVDIAHRNLKSAQEVSDSMVAFTIAYNAAVALSTVVLRACGYRTIGEGHHETLFESLKYLFPKDGETYAALFSQCRRMRNKATYVEPIIVTATQVEKLIKAIREFEAAVLALLKKVHPQFVPKSKS